MTFDGCHGVSSMVNGYLEWLVVKKGVVVEITIQTVQASMLNVISNR